MRIILSFFIVVFLSFYTSAHDYYFSFTEIEIDTVENRLEISIKMSAHDVEHYFESKDCNEKIETFQYNSDCFELFKSWINSKFRIIANDAFVKLDFVGHVVKTNDDLIFYFKSDFNLPKTCTFTIQNSLLFDFFPAQQNKVYFKINDWSQTKMLTREQPKMIFDYVEKK